MDYLTVNQNEEWNLKPVYENQKNDVHPPLYYLLLRISASFAIDRFSKWSGIILNIIIFTVSNVLVFKISKEKEFTKTEKFKEIFQSEIQHLESSISWGIFEENVYDEEFEQYNRSQTNVEYIFDIEQTNGKKIY